MVVADPSDFFTFALPGAFTSVGTVGLATITVWLARHDRLRDDEIRRADIERNELLRRQALEAESVRLKRAQAELISGWVAKYSPNAPYKGWIINLSNGSDQLVYDVLVLSVVIQGEGPSSGDVWMHPSRMYGDMPYVVLKVLPPGDSWIWVTTDLGGGVELGFTDRAGHSWLRRAGGPLEEIACGAPDHYEVERPIRYSDHDLGLGRYGGG